MQRLGEVAVGDQPAELRRAGDVGSFADVDEWDLVGQRERLEARKLQCAMALDRNARRLTGDGIGNCRDVGRRRATTAADDVDETGVGELAEDCRRLLRGLVVATECVRQPGVRVGTGQRVGDRRQLVDVRPHLGAAERAVETDGDRIGMSYRLPERLRWSDPTACDPNDR